MTKEQLRELYGFAIIEDTREQTPLDFTRATDIPTVRQKLDTGDYSATGFENIVTIERKNPEDLVSSVILDRARFERELKRMREGGFKLCVIYCEATYADIAAGAYRGRSNPKSVLGSLDAFAARYGVPTLFCSHPVYNIPRSPRIRWEALCARASRLNRQEMAHRIAGILKYFVREQVGKREWDRRQRLIEKAYNAENAAKLDAPPEF
ncbi:MAG: ERCC4 domain-containing protein [Kiritimatiellia bacterium]